MTDTAQVFARNELVEMAPLQQDSILFHPQSNRFCILNRTSSLIWDCLGTPTAAERIAEQLSARFEGLSQEAALADVHRALSTLLELDLVISRPSE